ncbi:MAG TPA: DoxX family protein [Roseiflexaceae bacterium]|jgi:putative oxidoreductase|nr:DoxX family protein [Roseiflexaceae bacterium]
MIDLALLVLRLTLGSLLAGHGAQKLFGSFGGPGMEGTKGMMGKMNLEPREAWAGLAGGSEFGGGVLTALGFLNPFGPMGVLGAMGMASTTAHAGKPIWGTAGGPELPVTNMSIAVALMLAGPGKYSLDEALGIKLPRWLHIVALLATLAGIGYGTMTHRAGAAQTAQPSEQG